MAPYRFIHTADWQIGMRASGLGVAGERVRAARLTAIKNVVAAAVTHNAHAILVAGDTFEDNQVSTAAVEQVAGLLNDATVPVFLLPGNHDPLTLGSVWRRDTWRTLRSHVRVITDAAPVELAPGVTLFPCPLATKNGPDDPTAAIPQRQADDVGLRIGLAHGTMRIRPDVGDDDFPIPLDAAERRGLDYLALGHWHSTLASPGQRAWYSGTHETTKFDERDSGNALLVTVAEAGRPPVVESIRTGTLTWGDQRIDFDTADADGLFRRFREWPDADRHLLRVTLGGRSTPATAAAIDQLRAVLTERFLHAAVDDSDLRPADSATALAELAGSAYLIAAADELAALATGSAGGAIDPLVAARALDLLHQSAWAARRS